jgi:hypothetical protein
MRKRIRQTCCRRVPLPGGTAPCSLRSRGTEPPGKCPLSGGNTGKKHFVDSKNELVCLAAGTPDISAYSGQHAS